jgi:Dolichyl-phosphate-mannose-protein mannosyltransferase
MNALLSLVHAIPAATYSLFEVTRPDHRTRRDQLLWLLAIVAAGAVLRFWGLGDIGLHREDEDTSALPVLGLLETGTSVYPSGMIYNRALLQTWLMAGSVWLFGNSEWSLRLPSALCGIALIVLGWQMGRRFLAPRWNLAFAAVLAFLPALISASQTARMYIFLLATLAAFATLVFRWERTGDTRDFLWALATLVLALQFHTLAVFAALLFFFPTLLHGDAQRLWLALLGTLVSLEAYQQINTWLGRHFPQGPPPGFADKPPPIGPSAATVAPELPLAWMVIGGALALAFAVLLARRIPGRWPALATGALALATLGVQLVPAYHLALLLFVATAVVAQRFGQRVLPLLAALAVASAVLAGLQMWHLQAAGIPSLKNIGGVLLGFPSVWAYARIADYSLLGAIVCVPFTAYGLWCLATRRSVPDVLLWLVLGGWLPLLAVGAFVWNPPPRYTVVTLLPMLLGAMAAMQWVAARLRRENIGVLLAAVALLVNPVVFARGYNAGYELHPDHVGAARFVLSQQPAPNDIIVAEDAIVQRYYLPRVDYWLMARESIIDFVRSVNGEIRDIYTGSLIIGNGADLEAVLDRPGRGAIYIIGSGENQEDGRARMRGPELQARLNSGEFPVVFEGRDGLTRVWRIPPPPR